MNTNSDPYSFLPLKSAAFHILLSLADGDRVNAAQENSRLI